ncbi:MAG: PAM68 family protein [Cyanobacteria bacterium J06638_28]
MPADDDRSPLPFEPTSKRPKPPKSSPPPKSAKGSVAKKKDAPASKSKQRYSKEETEIPEAVSRRMLRRMFFFSGIPVSLGVLIFFASYVVIIQGLAELPNVVVLLTTLACFGLSVVGLSYGALSASWEEEATGGLLGVEQFRVNFGRMVGSWREAREERRKNP